MTNNELLEPAKLYKTKLKEEHHSRAEKRFEELTLKSGVDIGKNQDTVAKYNKVILEKNKLEKKLAGANALKAFMIVLLILSLL